MIRPAAYFVVTVPTVYGIETRTVREIIQEAVLELQQYLPFTVLKRFNIFTVIIFFDYVGCNSTYRLRY